MKNPSLPLGLVASVILTSYTIAITSPESGDSLSPLATTSVTFTISPSAPSSTARLYDGATLVGTATVSGTSGTVVTGTPLSEGAHSLSVVLDVDERTFDSDVTTVTVRPAMVSMTVGTAFGAMVQSSGADLWTLPDASTATTETVDYTGTAGTATLRSSGITVLDFGYDGGDSGAGWDGTGQWNTSLATYGRAATSITAISGLADGAPGLQRFLASNTSLASVDFSGLSDLRVVEFYYSGNTAGNVSSATFEGCTALRRVCFENANLTELDISDATGIIDVRGRGQNFGASDFTVTIASTEHIEHLCVGSCQSGHSVLGLDGILTGTVACPVLREVWLWGINRPVVFAPHLGGGSGGLSIAVYDSQLIGLDTTNINWPENSNNVLDAANNPINGPGATCVISELTAARCPNLNLGWCGLSQALVDHVLEMYANHSALAAGSIDISGNAVPSATGLAHAEVIRARGMTVSVAT